MADIFTTKAPEPSDYIQGSVAGRDSTAAAIGAGLSGFAKILDVGAKYVQERKLDATLTKLDTNLKPEFDAFTQPGPEEAAIGTAERDVQDAMDPLRQKHKQGRMSRADFLSRSSAIVQQAINEHPRFEAQIRDRAKRMLGLNPSEAAIQLQMDEQKAVADVKAASDAEAYKFGTERGYARIDTTTGEVNYAATVQLGRTQQVVHNNMQNLKEDLAIETARLTVQRARDGNPVEVSDVEKRRLRRGMAIKRLVPLYNDEFDVLSDTLMFAINQNRAGGEAAQEKAVARELNDRSGNFARVIDSELDGSGELWDDEDRAGVHAEFERRSNAFVKMLTGPVSNVENNLRALQMAKTRSGLDFHEIAPPMAFIVDTVGGEAARDLINTWFGASNKEAHGVLLEDVQRVFRHVKGIAGGQQSLSNIPSDEKPEVSKSVGQIAMSYNNRAGVLIPKELDAWGNVTDDGLTTALSLSESNNVRKGTSLYVNPKSLDNLDALAKLPGQADRAANIGAKMFDVLWKNISLSGGNLRESIKALGTQTVTNEDIGAALSQPTLKYTPVFNGRTNRVEVVAVDAEGKPTNIAVPKAVSDAAAAINSSLALLPRTKDYAGPKEQALDVGQVSRLAAAVAGIPLKEGTQTPNKVTGEMIMYDFGMIEPGTMTPYDASAYPSVKNADGTQSNVKMMVETDDDGLVVVLPSMVGGKDLGREGAWEHYKFSGEHFGKFKTVKEALAYEEALHKPLEAGAEEIKVR